jgi:hypothetical protein
VLNDQNRFDDDRLIHTQMETAIELFHRPPHNCRVFNLSLGSPDVVLFGTNQRQTLWAEGLDTLARKHKVTDRGLRGQQQQSSLRTRPPMLRRSSRTTRSISSTRSAL